MVGLWIDAWNCTGTRVNICFLLGWFAEAEGAFPRYVDANVRCFYNVTIYLFQGHVLCECRCA